MLRIFRRQWLVLMVAGWMGSAAAAPITDIISVDGRDWAQVDLFTGLSWSAINAVCPSGSCSNGTLNGYDMAGWSWASVDDVKSLFNSYIGSPQLGPGIDTYSEVDSQWAPAFYAAGWRQTLAGFPPNNLDIISTGGLTNSCLVPSTCENRSFLWWTWGNGVPGPDTVVTDSHQDVAGPGAGAWFVRSNEIPVPATLPLLGLGFAALLAWRRKR